jgi:hypothetical protein
MHSSRRSGPGKPKRENRDQSMKRALDQHRLTPAHARLCVIFADHVL